MNNEVTSIIQDKKGFIWFGTRGGLHRFDGYEMKLLKNDFNKANNLLSQSVEVLQNGLRNNLWIGTKSGGLSSYDLGTGQITNYTPEAGASTGFNADYILSLLDTEGDRLLIGTWKGFAALDKKTGQFRIISNNWKTFDIQPDGQGGFWLGTNSGLRHLTRELVNDQTYFFNIPGINISAIVPDGQHHCLWLGTWDQGLFRLDTKTGAYTNYRHAPGKTGSLSSNNTYRLLLDSKGILWIGTWGGGLNRFDPVTGTAEVMDLSIPGLFTNDNQIILTLQEDPSGLLWVGTDGAGVFKMDLNPKRFTNIGYKSGVFEGTTHVLSVFVDPHRKLWLGTKSGRVRYSSDWKHFSNLAPAVAGWDPRLDSRAFFQEGNYLWIATNKGLIRLINDGQTVSRPEIYVPVPGDSSSISGKKVNVIARDSSGRIWIGTQESGLCCIKGYDRKNRPLFKRYFPAYGVKGALQNERVSCMLVDSRKRIWIGTYKGLHLYNPVTDDFSYFIQTGEPQHSISNNTILCLAEDRQGHIWAGTQYGLNKITDIEQGKLKVLSFTGREGLPSDYIHAVIPDRHGNIWASTNSGIVKISPDIRQMAVFDKRDGVVSDMFSENASCSDGQSLFFFGGVEGLTYFNPDSIKINPFSPPVYFTNLRINNKLYEFGKQQKDSTVLDRPFYETSSITLTHRENMFAIEFAALDYHAPDKNEYMYMLEGFNSDWVYAGNNRLVSFTNLSPGTYRLKVKATNNDKIWGEVPRELKIRILPPPWKTWWAYAIYISFFIFLLWLTRYFGLKQAHLRNQLQIANLARKQEKDLAEFKERLFTNISHEFRTPLTLIQGPVDDLLQQTQTSQKTEKSLRLVQKQSRRMLRMVNQLLDYQKAEAGSLKLSLQPGEIISFIQAICQGFQDEAARREIRFSVHTDERYWSMAYDPDKLEIILYNVLANAFKFTPNGGSISVRVQRDAAGNCEIGVQDSGRGIPPQEIGLIFGRFYRGKETDAANISGTGIGLSFVKELIELHGGSIRAESDGKNGSLFRIILPDTGQLGILPLSVQGSQPPHESQHDAHLNTIAMTNELEQEQSVPEPEQPIILVVEDEPDIQQYISDILSPTFKVVLAPDGKKGLEKALEIIPDVIVSDIMMPEMDGITLCKTLKSHKDTSHVPVILLTALSDMAHHVQGIREGADVYLPKPFNSQLLLLHIHNLINTRNKLKEIYAKKIFLGAGNFEIQSYEEEFLYKVMKIVEENISNSHFSSDELANLMFMSRSTFYRKLKSVTGMSGNEFVRTARLNYAVKLLESGKYSVTDAAFEAGFNDIKYFRKRFQDHFGVSPSDYKK